MQKTGGAAALALLLGGCAGLLDGNEQTILLISTPPGAACEVMRDGAQIASVARTPMSVQIASSPRPLSVTCVTLVHAPVTVEAASSDGVGTLGARLAGGALGRAIDTATLTDFRYPGTILVEAVPPPVRTGPLPLAH